MKNIFTKGIRAQILRDKMDLKLINLLILGLGAYFFLKRELKTEID